MLHIQVFQILAKIVSSKFKMRSGKTHLSLFIILMLLLTHKISAAHDSIFSKLSYGKGVTVTYLGSGAIKRHLDRNLLDSDVKAYYKTPAFVFGVDHCFYPYASNAYWGLGPFVSGWLAQRNYKRDNDFVKSTFYNILFAVRFTHHHSYFVRRKLDVFTSYIGGAHLNAFQSYIINDVPSTKPKSSFTPAIGMSLTVRYYFSKNIGIYGEGGIGYKINILNVGLCYKRRK
ncbi:hypothetical protein CNR22_14560 [Sphingobacteriaceae bacterium]|nr:hypothetical protein CNR22_14560 [Sphingobacteriaceae bacterium]